MAGLLVTLWVILVAQTSWSDIGVRKSGPFNMVVEKITKCEDEGSGEVQFGTKITRTSDGKYVYNNPIYSKYDTDQNMKVNFELQQFSNGGYRPRYITHTFKGCEEVWKYIGHILKRILESSGSVAKTCPVPAGNYTVKDIDVNNFSVDNLFAMIYNRYRSVITFYYKKAKVGCLQVYLEVVPK